MHMGIKLYSTFVDAGIAGSTNEHGCACRRWSRFSRLRICCKHCTYFATGDGLSNDYTASDGGWATAAIPVSLIQTIGTNQFRIRFTGDDDDAVADYVHCHSGEAAAGSQPELVIVHQ
jgi:hypothetical protein